MKRSLFSPSVHVVCNCRCNNVSISITVYDFEIGARAFSHCLPREYITIYTLSLVLVGLKIFLFAIGPRKAHIMVLSRKRYMTITQYCITIHINTDKYSCIKQYDYKYNEWTPGRCPCIRRKSKVKC